MTIVEEECFLDNFIHVFQVLVEKQKENLKKSNISIQFNYLIGEDASYIFVDVARLKQILQNLIDNALKFTNEGFIELNCSLIQNQFIQFSVKDTGIGISEIKQSIIFERFRQGDESATRRYGGNGLGLSIAKGLVTLLGGKIWVESELEKGSTFYFTIPYKPTKGLKEQKKNELLQYNWNDYTILLVEDNVAILDYLKEVLSEFKLNVLDAMNGKKAVEKFRSTPNLSLVLLDIQLPDTSGYELVKIFKEISPNIPVIAQTAYAMPEDKEKCLQAGCDDYISKPIDIAKLLAIVEKYLKAWVKDYLERFTWYESFIIQWIKSQKNPEFSKN